MTNWDQLNVLYIVERKKWRKWLQEHFETETEVWLLYPKKATGKPRILYNDAVEEALCFGWIDSIVRSYDKDHSAQKFSVRNPRSSYSQPNRERLKWLLANNLVHSSIIPIAKKTIKEQFIFPEDILTRIQEDSEVWGNYQNFSVAYQRIRIAYIDSARKRSEEFEKRLDNFIRKTKKNKRIGFGGIEKYY